MKRLPLFLIVTILALVACAPKVQAPTVPGLMIQQGENEYFYSLEDIKALDAVHVDNGEAIYVGVPIITLLADAGINATFLSAVKAVASDGFSTNYDPSLFLEMTTLVAYARADGPLASEEGILRMLVPDQGGFMNPRMLVTLIAIQ